MIVTVYSKGEHIPFNPFAIYMDVKNFFANKEMGISEFFFENEKISFTIKDFYIVHSLNQNDKAIEKEVRLLV